MKKDAPAANRTRTTGSGDLCDILFTTGADDRYTIIYQNVGG